MGSQFQEYPKCLYHPRHAPEGRVFQNAAQTAGLEQQGWVDTPAKFPPLSQRSIPELMEEFEAAEKDFTYWTKDGRCQPGSQRWEESSARYNSARDKLTFVMRAQELEAATPLVRPPSAKAGDPVFQTAFSTYKPVRKLGEGGCGEVRAVTDEDGKAWALKYLKPDSANKEKLKRFKNEILFGSRFKHPNIISVEDWGLCTVAGASVPFFVMEEFPDTLKKMMKAGISNEAILPWVLQILAGLKAAHDRGVWHRDLKPQNILCEAATGRLVISDFGIAHFTEEFLQTAVDTSPHDRLANFQYASPEQHAFRPVDHRSDIYSLGLIINEMFTGEIMQGTNPRDIGSVAPNFAFLDAVIAAMTCQSPDERPQSLSEVIDAIEPHMHRAAAVVAASESGHPPTPRGTTSRLGESRPAPAPTPTPLAEADEDVFDSLRLQVLTAADHRYPESAQIPAYKWSIDIGVAVGHVYEFLEQLHRAGYITISRWTGDREAPLEDWPSSKDFFDFLGADGASVRAKLRQQGKAFLLRRK